MSTLFLANALRHAKLSRLAEELRFAHSDLVEDKTLLCGGKMIISSHEILDAAHRDCYLFVIDPLNGDLLVDRPCSEHIAAHTIAPHNACPEPPLFPNMLIHNKRYEMINR